MPVMTDTTITRKKDNGEPGNGGPFGHVAHTDAEGVNLDPSVPVHERPLQVGFTFTRYSSEYDDWGTEVKTQTIDIRPILDTMALESLPSDDEYEFWDSSALEYAAIEAGYLDPGDCSVTADTSYLEEDHPVMQYVHSRRDAGLDAPLTDRVPLSRSKQYEKVGETLRGAYQRISPSDVHQAIKDHDMEWMHRQFKEASAAIEQQALDAGWHSKSMETMDEFVADDIRKAAEAPEDEFEELALVASRRLADRLVNRPYLLEDN